MKTLSNYKEKIYLGLVNAERIYLSAPSWDCGWYWGFGYLGNRNCHYHLDGLEKIETYNFEAKGFTCEFVNLYEGLKKHFGDSFIVKEDKDIWILAELFKSFYTAKEYAGFCHTGGAHMTNNPCKELLKNSAEELRINEIVLPQIFEEIYKVLAKYTTVNAYLL